MSKRIVVCFDGTWNTSDGGNGGTNVAKFYRSVLGDDKVSIEGGAPPQSPSMPTIKWYDPGVGTAWYDRIRGGVFGYGLSLNIRQGYKFLIDNYEAGDEIYIFGFSRGAYTARSLAGLMRNIGLMKKEHAPKDNPDDNPLIEEGYEIYREREGDADNQSAKEFRESYSWENSWDSAIIKFLGVWDTVGALGVPGSALKQLDERYAFHDPKLSKIVQNAYHAVAIDEHRGDYKATLWDSPQKGDQKMEQVWFVGAHSDVGGGSNKPAISDIGLRWIQDRARLDGKGLEFDVDQLPQIGQSYLTAKVSDSYGDFLWGLYGFVRRLFGRGRYYRPVKQLENGNESIHNTALEKMSQDRKYKPKNRGLR